MTTPATLSQIEAAARELAAERASLSQRVELLTSELQDAKSAHIADVKRMAGNVARREAELRELLASAPELFVKPRTMIFHGFKVGWMLNAGSVEVDDADSTVERIRRHLKDRFDELVKTTFSVRKDALRELTPAELRLIGARVEGAGDAVVCKPTDGEIEKLVERMIGKIVSAAVEPEAAG